MTCEKHSPLFYQQTLPASFKFIFCAKKLSDLVKIFRIMITSPVTYSFPYLYCYEPRFHQRVFQKGCEDEDVKTKERTIEPETLMELFLIMI